jgi:hypothetical protein
LCACRTLFRLVSGSVWLGPSTPTHMILATRLDNRINSHRIYPKTDEIMDLIAALTVFNRIAETGWFSAVVRETNN